MLKIRPFLLCVFSLPLFLSTYSVMADSSNMSSSEARSLALQMESVGANVVFMRHASAPGFGDPNNFQLGECATQRNLSDAGRQQAYEIGVLIKDAGVQFTDIRSSEWCRCKDTAELLDLGDWQTFSGLNSFFQGYVNRDKTLAELESYLNRLAADDRVLLVTHQVVISAITGISPASGGLVLYNRDTNKASRWSW